MKPEDKFLITQALGAISAHCAAYLVSRNYDKDYRDDDTRFEYEESILDLLSESVRLSEDGRKSCEQARELLCRLQTRDHAVQLTEVEREEINLTIFQLGTVTGEFLESFT